MIVADANLLAYLIMPGERTAEAEAVLDKDPTWVAPALWRSELRSVVHKYIARGDLTIARAVSLLGPDHALSHFTVLMDDAADVLALAVRSKCSTYDCEYVALAQTLGVPLVTTDRAILKAFPAVAMTPAVFLGA